MSTPDTFYLDSVGVRKEFFLRLEQRHDKVGRDGRLPDGVGRGHAVACVCDVWECECGEIAGCSAGGC